MKYSKKAKKIYSKTKSPYEVHPFKTISITDLNWLVESIKVLESENKAFEQLKGVYTVTNDDWKRLHMALTEITSAYQDTKMKNDDFIFTVGEILKKCRDS
ncbi:hypothetical protein [Bacillus atrophaeus]|uniref:hypothetical protein n=1 Tax=Bacillus atrophaeus TaxID=1452 RepID=UPI003F592AE3